MGEVQSGKTTIFFFLENNIAVIGDTNFRTRQVEKSNLNLRLMPDLVMVILQT